jgi:hypothetical protein
VTLRPVMESEAAIRQMTFVPMLVLRHLRLYSNSIHLMYLVVVSTPANTTDSIPKRLSNVILPFRKTASPSIYLLNLLTTLLRDVTVSLWRLLDDRLHAVKNARQHGTHSVR